VAESIENYCVVYFGNDWSGESRTSSHHIAARLSSATRVLYVETPGMRAPQAHARDFRKLFRKLTAALAPPVRAHDRLHILTLPQIPFRKLPLVGLLNRIAGRWAVGRALRRLGFDRVISWFVVPHPGALAGRLGERLVVYYCIDDYAAFPGVDAASIQALDDDLTRRADIVFVAASALVEPKRRLNANVRFSPHGVDVDLFARADDSATEPAEATRGLQRPVIGYFGNIGPWIDRGLLLEIARRRPEWTLLLVGHVTAPVEELRSCPNVMFAGQQRYESLFHWAAAFDVAVIPYLQTRQVRNANPLKLREYLATGKPVVTVTTPETVRFGGVVALADTPEDFVAAIERALAEDTPELHSRRRSSVRDASWDARFRETVAAVEQTLARHEAEGNVERELSR